MDSDNDGSVVNLQIDSEAIDVDYESEKEYDAEQEKRKRTSAVWKYYKNLSKDTARCRYCQKVLSYRTTVSNLKKHLRKVHGVVATHDGPGKIPDSNESDTGAKLFRKPLPRRSDTWKYFYIDDESAKIANCKLCGKDVPYHTVSELQYHIVREHGRIELGDVTSSDGEKEAMQVALFHPSNGKKRSEGWKYFNLKDPVNKIATCKGCRKDLSYQTVSNLMKHVIRAHSKTSFKFRSGGGEKQDLRECSFVRKYKPQRKFRSVIWKYFDVENAQGKIAKCRLCANNFSYNCLANLGKHLKRKHEGVMDDQSSDETEVETEAESDHNTPVWDYFKCLDQSLKIASCLTCKKRVDYNDDHDLFRHLSRKHPHVDVDTMTTKPKKLMITGNGDIYEIEEDVTKKEPVKLICDDENDSDGWPHNNDEVDALHSSEYLDEDIFEEPQHVPTKKKRKRFSNLPSNVQRPSDEESSLDIFGKYIVSLLKKLPKHKSDQLQLDFVKQIMEAELNNESNRKTETVENITCTSQSAGNDDTRVTSNSDAQKIITRDGVPEMASDEIIVSVTKVSED